MIPKITLIPQNNLYKTNCSTAVCNNPTPSFGHAIPNDSFNKESVSLEKAINIICSNIKENMIVKLSNDTDPLRHLSNMILEVEKLNAPDKVSVKFGYETSDGGTCSIPVLSSSPNEIKQKMSKKNFIEELKEKIMKTSLKELVPDDYHDSLD